MAIRFSCTCGTEMQADERYAGSSVQCPRCGGVVLVPIAFVAPPPFAGESSTAMPRRLANGKRLVPNGKKAARQSNNTIWLAMLAGALIVVAAIAVGRMFLSWTPQAPEPDAANQAARDRRDAAKAPVRSYSDPKAQDASNDPPARDPLARPSRRVIAAPNAKELARKAADPDAPPAAGDRQRFDVRTLIDSAPLNGPAGDGASVVGTIIEVQGVIQQVLQPKDGVCLVLLSEPGRQFGALEQGDRVSCYGTSQSFRATELRPGQAIIVAGTCRGKLKPMQGSLRIEVGNTWLLDCQIVFLGAAPPEAIANDAPQRAPAPQPQTPNRLPVPDVAAQQRAEQEIREVFNARLVAGMQGNDTRGVIRELTDLASREQDPTLRYVELKIACDLARDAGNLSLAFTIVDELAKNYELNGLEYKRGVMELLIASAPTRENLQQCFEKALFLAGDAQAAGLNDTSKALLAVAETVTKKVKSPEGPQQLQECKTYLAASQKLTTAPDDPAANLAAGRYLCFVRSDWKEGPAKLAKGNDPLLRAAGQKELGEPNDPTAQVELANDWWNAHSKAVEPYKSRYASRALNWYQTALPRLPAGLQQTLAQARIDELSKGGGAANMMNARADEQRRNVGLVNRPIQPVAPRGNALAGMSELIVSLEAMTAEIDKQTTLKAQQDVHRTLLQKLDDDLSRQTWRLNCRVRGSEPGDGELLLLIDPPDEAPDPDSGWVANTVPVPLAMPITNVVRVGDYVTFTGTPRLGIVSTGSFNAPYLTHRGKAGNAAFTHVVYLENSGFIVQTAAARLGRH